MSKSYLGVIVSDSLYQGISRARKSALNQIKYYEKAAIKNKLKPCYFRYSHVHQEQNEILALVKKEKSYKPRRVPVPKVVYNLIWTFPRSSQAVENLKQAGSFVFNETNYLEKYKFHLLLDQNQEFSAHLPHTEKVTPENLYEMMQNYNQLLIKPDDGFVGRGIMKLEKLESNMWSLFYQIKKGNVKTWEEKRFNGELPSFLVEWVTERLYLIQEAIPLATYKGAPFDFRVATQRNGMGEWEVTAIIGKVAKRGRFLSNIGQGGTSQSMETLISEYPHLSVQHLSSQITTLALKLAEYIAENTDHIADLGFDIGITPEGFPYFIECNFLSAYKTLTFRKGKLVYREWKSVFTTPIEYARYLLENL